MPWDIVKKMRLRSSPLSEQPCPKELQSQQSLWFCKPNWSVCINPNYNTVQHFCKEFSFWNFRSFVGHNLERSTCMNGNTTRLTWSAVWGSVCPCCSTGDPGSKEGRWHSSRRWRTKWGWMGHSSVWWLFWLTECSLSKTHRCRWPSRHPTVLCAGGLQSYTNSSGASAACSHNLLWLFL